MTRLILSGIAILLASCSDSGPRREAVLYSSVDETYARRAAEAFEKETGIHVNIVSDTEAAKSAGLVARLLAEKDRPTADVFWSGDVARALALESAGMLEAAPPADAGSMPAPARLAGGRITAAAQRVRVIMIHRELAPPGAARPQSVEDLAKPEFAQRSCMANPLFGTAAVHAAALFRAWGDVRAKQFFNDFARNGGTMVASNGEVKRRVGSGAFAFGLTDSDDLHVAWLDGKPVDAVIPVTPEQGGLMMPSAAVLLRGAPHPAEGRLLAAWLSGERAERLMAESEAAHWPVRPGLPVPEKFRGLPVPAPLDSAAWAELSAMMPSLVDGFLTEWTDRRR